MVFLKAENQMIDTLAQISETETKQIWLSDLLDQLAGL